MSSDVAGGGDPQWASVEHVASYVGVSTGTVRQWAAASLLRAHRSGRRLLFKPDEVDDWIAGQRRGAELVRARPAGAFARWLSANGLAAGPPATAPRGITYLRRNAARIIDPSTTTVGFVRRYRSRPKVDHQVEKLEAIGVPAASTIAAWSLDQLHGLAAAARASGGLILAVDDVARLDATLPRAVERWHDLAAVGVTVTFDHDDVLVLLGARGASDPLAAEGVTAAALALIERGHSASNVAALAGVRPDYFAHLARPAESNLCQQCGDGIEQVGRGRRRLYCSPICRQRAARLRELDPERF